eukprot:CAMPEP_0181242338 /NCGR_PEP_ID=MMETSP1096-20121128/41626_1 /TAXON_ID=156174 ORGANISM="Chrysochromulina ericina, Strain CCMP281" /NCGR_SAMPLE_ID=MMETSP1096 /ASSEMBLY_ACC=CAM_ASM_000453 /LENGTH=64 /DNA_ID=CAMNT_0023338519 /DNA_START=716 /DNA_END=911 /DNA_ORIENTATION=-
MWWVELRRWHKAGDEEVWEAAPAAAAFNAATSAFRAAISDLAAASAASADALDPPLGAGAGAAA